eukprot:gene14982-17717_t
MTNIEGLVNVNVLEPNQIKPFKPRLAPYDTTATLDFLVTPGTRKFSDDELDKFAQLARALTSIGYEHTNNERWAEALESYTKALFHVRNIFGSDQTRFSLREYAALMLNMAESHSRLEAPKEAILRSQQAIDLLEIDWREQLRASRERISNLWLKDELLGVAYQNMAEYLAGESRHAEAEPFIRAAYRILPTLYPLDHPVNVDNGMLMVQILNECGRSKEAGEVTERFGSVLTDAVGSTEKMRQLTENLDEEMVDKIIDTVHEKYPEFNDDEDESMVNRGREEMEEEEDEKPSAFRENDFGVQDLLAESESNAMATTTTDPSYGELDFDEMAMAQEDDADDEELAQYGDEDAEEQLSFDRALGLKIQMDPEEKALNRKYERELRNQTKLLPEDQDPLNRLLNQMNALMGEGTEKMAFNEHERVVDRDRRIRNRPSEVADNVSWRNGDLESPVDDNGEAISQATLDKMSKYMAEELEQKDMDDDKELMDEYMEKMLKIVEQMDDKETKALDEHYSLVEPILKDVMSKSDDEAAKYFNLSLKDLHQEEEELATMAKKQRPKPKEEQDDFEDINNNLE